MEPTKIIILKEVPKSIPGIVVFAAITLATACYFLGKAVRQEEIEEENKKTEVPK